MNNDEKNLEIKVGIFVFIGLIAIAIMAVQFGRLGQGLAKYYPLKVEFPNASGLLKNSDVQLAGAIVRLLEDDELRAVAAYCYHLAGAPIPESLRRQDAPGLSPPP